MIFEMTMKSRKELCIPRSKREIKIMEGFSESNPRCIWRYLRQPLQMHTYLTASPAGVAQVVFSAHLFEQDPGSAEEAPGPFSAVSFLPLELWMAVLSMEMNPLAQAEVCRDQLPWAKLFIRETYHPVLHSEPGASGADFHLHHGRTGLYWHTGQLWEKPKPHGGVALVVLHCSKPVPRGTAARADFPGLHHSQDGLQQPRLRGGMSRCLSQHQSE